MYEHTLRCEGYQKLNDTKYKAGRERHSSALMRKCVAIATVSATENLYTDASTKRQNLAQLSVVCGRLAGCCSAAQPHSVEKKTRGSIIY